MATKRIVVEIDERLHRKFTTAVKTLGSNKTWALEKMIKDFILNAEAVPNFFELMKNRNGVKNGTRIS